MTKQTPITTVILGASGYTGGELLRLAVCHPGVELVALTAERHAGKPVAAVFPHLAAVFGVAGEKQKAFTRIEEIDWSRIGAAFCCLPHGETQEIVAAIPEHVKIIDLSADFRLADIETYAEWYGHPHRAPALQATAVYGLSELAREKVKPARLVANPGCYPTAVQLPLVPLLEAGAILDDGIVIDAKSGVSGAGRKAVDATLFSEVSEGVHAYNVARHRHAPEIEAGLSAAAGRPLMVSFTPHLIPMNRGILATIYVRLAKGSDANSLRQVLAARYDDEPFVHLTPPGVAPATRHVRGSNHCLIGVFEDRLPGRAILISVIDNLVKGAAGQAVQNFNLMTGFPEGAGLEQAPLFP